MKRVSQKNQKSPLTRPIALVTGASGDIGFAISSALLAQGYDLVAQYHTSRKRNAMLQKIAHASQRSVEFIRADFSKQTDLRSFIHTICPSGGRRSPRKFNAVIHCAGVNEKKWFPDITEKDFDRIFATNTKAPLFIMQALLAGNMLAKNASIIFMGSPNSFVGGSLRNMLYTGSKTALLGWHKNLAKELAPHVQVNSVVPGYIDTKMLREKNNVKALGEKKSIIPSARFGKAEEIANVIIFLISEQGRYITGQSIHVNGGLYLG